jgi:outer membrane protein OmpA-like peptidoglycan-associated protein
MKKEKISRISVLFVLFLMVLFFGSGEAVRLTVPTQYRSIRSALQKVQLGDTVFVKNGVYRENIVLVDDIVLMGENIKKTIIDGQRQGPVVVGADNCVITQFTIRNGTVGIYCAPTAPTIAHNIIIDNKGSGIMCIMSLPSIKSNVIMRNDWTGIFCQSVKSINTAIENNVIIENGYNGIHCANATQVLVKNNILIGNDEYGVWCDQAAKKTRIIYNNIIWNMLGRSNVYAILNKTNLKKDPMFNNPAATLASMDYYCKAVSPMKKAGENKVDMGLLSKEAVVQAITDQDNDGIPDRIDACPDYDNDEDGIFDKDDKCPLEPEDKDGFEDMDGCPDLDNDGDGIPDARDGAPNDPETFNGYKDEDGIPDETPKEIKATLVLEGINFRTGSAELLDESFPILEVVFNSLEAFPHVNVEIGGHTDAVGSKRSNKILSQERAKSVKSYLVNRGISPHRLKTKGYGEDFPVSSNKTAEGRRQNRRIEFKRLN